MRTLLKVGFALLLLAFLLIGLSFNLLRANGTSVPVNHQGRALASETRSVGAGIAAIDLQGPINLTLRQGAVPSLTVKGEKRMLDKVETTQDNDTLHIGIKGMLLHHREPLQVVLVIPSLARVLIASSGDTTINGFSGDNIDLQLHGSGDVKFNGRFKEVRAVVEGSGDMEVNGGASEQVEANLTGSGRMTVVGSSKQFTVAQSGSGDLDAEHLAADQAQITLQGSGTSTVQALKSVSVTLRGSGDVRVLGNPDARDVNRTGSGDVSFDHHD